MYISVKEETYVTNAGFLILIVFQRSETKKVAVLSENLNL